MSDPKLTLQNLLFGPDSMLPVSSNVALTTGPSTNSVAHHDREQTELLDTIARLDAELMAYFENKMFSDRSLSRQLVSFQANKQRAEYRWYKYKEAFSAPLIDFLLSRYQVDCGTILDPFAGAGTALFVAAAAGLNAEGIELLPIGQEIIQTRLMLRRLNANHFARLKTWVTESEWSRQKKTISLPTLRITEGAYPKETIDLIEKYLSAANQESTEVGNVLRFALLCVLESVSFTRKDGQYLRWDYRSGRKQGAKRFDKGEIVPFKKAISAKINEILNDISSGSVHIELFNGREPQGQVRILPGSCLDILPKLKRAHYDAIVTSPPYCNRYDYTRTYALELALLGVTEDGLRGLRQEMLSCTVENRAKDLLFKNPAWEQALDQAQHHPLLQAIIAYLEWCRERSVLNNSGIPRMVRGYFYEMACVIAECSRILKPGASLIMVNDNVRYAGASVSVDLILASLAESLGFVIEKILVLPDGKGNSSQQMGLHGRDVLRKCVYVWKRNHRRTVVT